MQELLHLKRRISGNDICAFIPSNFQKWADMILKAIPQEFPQSVTLF